MVIETIEKNASDAIEFLKELVEIPSLSGHEEAVIRLVHDRFSGMTDECELIPLSNEIRKDRDYSTPIPDIEYDGRYNLRAIVKGRGRGRSILFNSHTDVVPPSALQKNPFNPVVRNGKLYGRGACDAKGQIATMFFLLKTVNDLKIKFNGDLKFHIVVEEENGGNGTLSMIRRGEQADAAIVMEPTSLKLLSAVRGAIWFRGIFKGIPGHSGSGGKRISALDLAIEAKSIMQRYHDELLANSKGIELFDAYADPMPITFGKLHAGDWPATIPNQAVMEGVLGFLTNVDRYRVMDELEKEIMQRGSEELKHNFELEFMYRHDAHAIGSEHPILDSFRHAFEKASIPLEISAMAASCDSWFYHNQLNIPTVVFGPGDLAVAHSNVEHIEINHIVSAVEILIHFIYQWCGIKQD